MKYPRVLIDHSKHGDYYHLIESVDDFFAFAIQVLTTRVEEGYWYLKPAPIADTLEEFFRDVHDMTMDDARQLADDFGNSVKIGSRSPLDEISYTTQAYDEQQTCALEYANIIQAVKNQDGKAAWKILSNRNAEGHQYEQFDHHVFENRID